MGQGVKIAPRTVLRALKTESRYVDGLMMAHASHWDTRPLATVIPFPVERRLASMNNDAS
jgi:hypothetical protein